jgi:hypothetical protein
MSKSIDLNGFHGVSSSCHERRPASLYERHIGITALGMSHVTVAEELRE